MKTKNMPGLSLWGVTNSGFYVMAAYWKAPVRETATQPALTQTWIISEIEQTHPYWLDYHIVHLLSHKQQEFTEHHLHGVLNVTQLFSWTPLLSICPSISSTPTR